MSLVYMVPMYYKTFPSLFNSIAVSIIPTVKILHQRIRSFQIMIFWDTVTS